MKNTWLLKRLSRFSQLFGEKYAGFSQSIGHVHIFLEIIYVVAENNVASTVNRKLGEGVH